MRTSKKRTGALVGLAVLTIFNVSCLDFGKCPQFSDRTTSCFILQIQFRSLLTCHTTLQGYAKTFRKNSKTLISVTSTRHEHLRYPFGMRTPLFAEDKCTMRLPDKFLNETIDCSRKQRNALFGYLPDKVTIKLPTSKIVTTSQPVLHSIKGI